MNTPRATYRVQLHREFTFRDARAIVPYLARLGISHLYTSPFLKARAGSVHGYDVVNHNSLNPEIGDAADLDSLVDALRAHDMNLMLDLVPNHMGVLRADNHWWLDVLEHGHASVYAEYFDIEWTSASADLAGKVLVPILGDQYGTVLERGELELRFDADNGAISLWYFDNRLPVRPSDYPGLLLAGAEDLQAAAQGADALRALRVVATSFAAVSENAEACVDPSTAATRSKAELAAACLRFPCIAHRVAANVRAVNGHAGHPASFDALHALITRQAYRLAFWRVAADDINYRRFFDINDLAALRAERKGVFDATHRIALELVGAGKADGLRIDHPDGLSDPAGYFARLQQAAAIALDGRAAPDAQGRAIYIVIEKILASHERLPPTWPVHGTTGYDFMNIVNRLFVDPDARGRFDRLYALFTGEHASFDTIARESKVQIIAHSMRSELTRLTTALTRIAKADRRTCDFTRDGIQRALTEIVACFPVYRTYARGADLTTDDMQHIKWALAMARRRSTAADTSVFDFIAAILRGGSTDASAPMAAAVREFRSRFQQFTAPVMAKGTEDTAFYVYNRLVSLNEVGGDPRIFGTSISAFHAASILRARDWPHTMLATSTHDSKRGEDVRTRIDALSEMPAQWRLALRRWRRSNRRHRRESAGRSAPSRNDEYLLYQTLVGSWPAGPLTQDSLDAYRARIGAYMLKAVREAKTHTSWLNPDPAYENALANFIERLLDKPQSRFIESLLPLHRALARIACISSLAQTLCKLTLPGVPDTYQGSEMWDLNLVDPDNRRKVDYTTRERTLNDFVTRGDDAPPAVDLLTNWEDGRVKLWLTWRLLQLRKRHAQWFERAGYMPVAVRGEHAQRICAYARRHAQQLLLCVVPRLWSSLTDADLNWPLGAQFWGDTHLVLPAAAQHWHNVLTGEYVTALRSGDACLLGAGTALATFPLGALMLRAS